MANAGEVTAKIVLDGIAGVKKTLGDLSKGMDKAGDSFKTLGKNLDGISTKMKDAGSALQPLTVGLTAFGTAGILASEQIDNVISQFQSKMGATGKDLAGYETNLKNVAKTGVGSFEEVATAIVDVNQNMKGLSGKELENVTENATQIAKVMGYDVTKTAGVIMKTLLSVQKIDQTQLMRHSRMKWTTRGYNLRLVYRINYR